MSEGAPGFEFPPGAPDLSALPWHLPLAAWRGRPEVVELARGPSRHEVVFVQLGRQLLALKELPPGLAARELRALRWLADRALPAVQPLGEVRTATEAGPASVLVTRYLEASLPYRALFEHEDLARYRAPLLDAVADLLVRLHLAGFWWGDFSLSNALFRRDAGQLQAYLVDAETSEWHPALSEGQRSYDLDLMEEHVAGDLSDVAASLGLPPGFDVFGTGGAIRARYVRLWAEVTREVTVGPGESWRIHERLARLQELGFSVGDVELEPAGDTSRLRVRTIVTDRDWHRHQLQALAAVDAEERQATLLLGEIRELRATLARESGRDVPLEAAAWRWRADRYEPTVKRLRDRAAGATLPELYCQVLEHKWLRSERAGHDVGLERALESYLDTTARPAG